MRRIHVWLCICGFLLLAAGGALGFLARAWLNGDASTPDSSGLPLPDYPSYWLLRSQEIWKELKLDDEQKQRIKDLLTEHYRKDRELRGRLQGLATAAHAELAEVLTDEQRNFLSEIQSRYSVTHVEAEAIREFVEMRREIGLTVEQEPDVFQVAYDYALEKRDYFKGLGEREGSKRPDRSAVRKELDEMSERRLERLAMILDAEQLEQYRNLIEERRRWWEKRRHRRGKKGPDKKGGERRGPPEAPGECPEPPPAPPPEP